MISTINNPQNLVFVVISSTKLCIFHRRPLYCIYILQEMDFRFLLVTKHFRNSGFGTIFTKRDVGMKKVVSTHP